MLATGSFDDDDDDDDDERSGRKQAAAEAATGNDSDSSSSSSSSQPPDGETLDDDGTPNAAWPRGARLGGPGARAAACVASRAADVALGLDGLVGLGACSAAQGLFSLRATAGSGPPAPPPPPGAGPLASLCVSARSAATLAAAARALGLPGCNTAPFASVIADEAEEEECHVPWFFGVLLLLPLRRFLQVVVFVGGPRARHRRGRPVRRVFRR